MTPQTNVIPTIREMLLEWSSFPPEAQTLAAYRRVLGCVPLDELKTAIREFAGDTARKGAPSARELSQAVAAARRRGLPQEAPYDPSCPFSEGWRDERLCRSGWRYRREGLYEVAQGYCDCKAGRARR